MWRRACALALGLALTLLVGSFGRIVGDANSAAFGNNVLDAVLAGSVWGTALGWNILRFTTALAALHIAFGLLCWLLARGSAALAPRAALSPAAWVLAWFAGLTLWLLLANAALFPHSSLGSPYAELARAAIWPGVDAFAVISCIAASAVVVVVSAHAVRRVRGRGATVSTVLGVTAVIAGFALPPRTAPAPPAQPHVILIGVDSLRCDATVLCAGPGRAPHIDAFLSQAFAFTDAITPLARTFPSWVTVLTGRHPRSTGALVNLLPRDLVHEGETLPRLLSRAGYRTVYGIDEARFSNLDASYGFDRVVTPPMGASDFLIGWFSDTPLSNVVTNTWLGRHLFPLAHANRAFAVTYDPDTFVERIAEATAGRGPLFLAAHMTLAHWPFFWSDAPPIVFDEIAEARPLQYAVAVRRVDEQFRDLMQVLERRGLLSNALVVLFSDHGEALGQPDDSALPDDRSGLTPHEHGALLGHGTSVLSPHQYRVVLGMRAYGAARALLQRRGTSAAPVSLEDLTPTLIELLGLDATGRFDGRSLAPLLQGREPDPSLAGRVRFTETEFNPRGVAATLQLSPSAVSQAALYYRVDPVTDRIEMRREKVRELLGSRQLAAIGRGQLLAAIPGELARGYHFLLLDRRGGVPQRLTHPPSPASQPEAAMLWEALHARFASQLGAVSPIPGTM